MTSSATARATAAASLAMALGAAAQPAATSAPPATTFLATLYAPLEAPQAISSGLLIFHPRAPGRIEGRVHAEILHPTGDWVRIMPNGSMRIDVRLTARLDDGELLYMTYNGVLKKPEAASWERFLRGEKIGTPEWYYVIAPTFETRSQRYGWLNDLQALGKFVSIQTGENAHVLFDLYAVE